MATRKTTARKKTSRTPRKKATTNRRTTKRRKQNFLQSNLLLIVTLLLLAGGWCAGIYFYLQNQELRRSTPASYSNDVLQRKAEKLAEEHPNAEVFQLPETLKEKKK
ncbi:MAG: hypothetical protein AAF984_10465 [Verrucomicrobiota bacterium]